MELTLGMTGIAIAAFALFLGCTVYSATGFGIAMTATPIALLAIGDPQMAVVVVNTAGVSAGILIAIQARKDVPYREIIPIAAAGALGAPVGVSILKFADPTIIRIGIAVLILALAAMSLKEVRPTSTALGITIDLSRSKTLQITYMRIVGIFAGFVVGITLAAFAVGGPLIVLFLLARNLQRHSVRSAMAFFLLVVSVVGLGFYASAGLYNVERLTLIAIVIVPAIIGFALGGLLIKRMNERIFRYVVLGIIALSSMAVLVPEVARLV